MIRRMLILAVALAALLATPAFAQYSLVLDQTLVAAGGVVTASGSGCQPGETVTIYLAPDTSTAAKATDYGTEVATGTANDQGEFSIPFTVPAGTPDGMYTVTAVCGTQVLSASLQVGSGTGTTVTPTTSRGTTGGTTGPLAKTGSDLSGAFRIGAVLLTVGGLLVVGTRKRRTNS